MPTLYNAVTRQPEELDGDALQQALAQGTHTYAAGETVPGFDPAGQPVNIPAENVGKVVSAGYRVQTPTEQATEKAVSDFQSKNPGVIGSLKVMGTEAINQLGMGIPEMIFNKTADPLEVAKAQAIAKEYELSDIAGGTAGFVGSLFLGSPLFKAAGAAGEVATKAAANMATKIGIATGGEVGTRTATQFAGDLLSNIAAKGIGGTVEGALISAPHAVTEAVLGDPNDAAESLLAGGAIGGVLGGSGPIVKGLFNLGKAGVEKAAELTGQAIPTLEGGARKLAEAITGVPQDKIKQMAESWDRISASPPPEIEGIKDIVDSAVAQRQETMDAARQKFEDAQRQMRESYGFARQDLAKTAAPEGLADSIMSAMEDQKAKLGDLSNQADEALANSGATIRKNQIVDFLDNIASSVGAGKEKAVIGEEALGAVNKIKALSERVQSGLGDEVDGPTMRDVMRQVRQDINFNQAAGTFNDTANKLKKKFTEGISSMLKEQSPDYAEKMAQMREMTDTLGEMSKTFGEKTKAVSSLNNLDSPTGKLKRDLLERFQEQTGQDFTGQLKGLDDARALMKESMVRDVSDKLVPGLHGAAKDAEADYLRTKQAFDDVKRLNQNRTQSIVSRAGFKNASIEDRRALERLSGDSNQDFMQMIEDRNLIDEFDKARPAGSKRTNIMAILGGALGGLVGGVHGAELGAGAGSVFGASLDHTGGGLLKKLMEKRPDLTGLLFVEKQMKIVADKMDQIPDILDKLSEKLPGAGIRSAAIGAIGRIQVRDYKPPMNNPQQAATERVKHLEKLSDQMASIVANPSAATSMFASMSQGVGDKGAPNIAAAFNQKLADASTYLYNEMPKPQEPVSPFAKPAPFRPSDAQVTAFEQKLAVVHDPWIVLKELEEGNLTKNHVDALQAVYPYIYSEMQKSIQKASMNHPKPLPYQQRIKIGTLMKITLDRSDTPAQVQLYQQMYAQPQQGLDQSKGFKVNLAENTMTEAEKATYK